jgi:hypothetical protein
MRGKVQLSEMMSCLSRKRKGRRRRWRWRWRKICVRWENGRVPSMLITLTFAPSFSSPAWRRTKTTVDTHLLRSGGVTYERQYKRNSGPPSLRHTTKVRESIRLRRYWVIIELLRVRGAQIGSLFSCRIVLKLRKLQCYLATIFHMNKLHIKHSNITVMEYSSERTISSGLFYGHFGPSRVSLAH